MPVLKTALQPEACCRHPGAASASLPHLEAGVQESLHMASGRVYPKILPRDTPFPPDGEVSRLRPRGSIYP